VISRKGAKAQRKIRESVNVCFACGPENAQGLRLKFSYTPERHFVICNLMLEPQFQGATGFAHGGIIATLLDEAMAKSNGLGGTRAVTLRLTTKYRKMVPIQKKLTLTGWRTAKRGRKLFLRAELHDSKGTLLSEGSGLFLQME
jgi:acyl-coenzyme A thioesterase PaaI-like protein